jgi:hypothetical protein
VSEPFDDHTGLMAEMEELLKGHALARRLAQVVHAKLLSPARELLGDRAVPWIAATLRTTAEVLERGAGRPPA